MSEPSTPQPDDERPVTGTPDERHDHQDDTSEYELGQDDDLRAGQVGPDETRP